MSSPRGPASRLLSQFGVLLSLLPVAFGKIHPIDPAKNITWPYQVFKTVDFTPPWLNITHHTKPSEGYLFFAPDGATETQLGPLIMTASGDLVWNGPPEHAFNFGVYDYQGAQVLGWWNGTLYPEPVGRGNGVIYLYDNKYDQTHKVTLPGNFLEQVPGATFASNIDVHELQITTNGSLIVTANNVTQADLTSVGGPANGWVVDGLVYEIDIATNEVLFRWSSLEHLDQLPFTDSLFPIGSEGLTGANQSLAWGYFHINAVDQYDGGYVISSRYFCSAIAIDGDGQVKWRLSGRTGGDFNLVGSDATTGFCYQHDVRVFKESFSGVILHMHDNHNSPIENGTVPSTAKSLNVNFDSKEATLQHRFINASGPIYSTAQGNYQTLGDGNIFVGHGWIPVMEEFSPSGEILTTIQFGAAEPRPGGGYLSVLAPTLSYRSFKQHWVGCPSSKPDVVAKSVASGTKVYVSWNGATEVESWEIYGGSSKNDLKCLATVPKSGFETEAKIKAVEYVKVVPVLKKGSACTAKPSSAVISVS